LNKIFEKNILINYFRGQKKAGAVTVHNPAPAFVETPLSYYGKNTIACFFCAVNSTVVFNAGKRFIQALKLL